MFGLLRARAGRPRRKKRLPDQSTGRHSSSWAKAKRAGCTAGDRNSGKGTPAISPMERSSRGSAKPRAGSRSRFLPASSASSSRRRSSQRSRAEDGSPELCRGAAEKPRRSTAWMIFGIRSSGSAPGAGSTVACPRGRLTAIWATPGKAPTTRSMRAEQAAQCIPPTVKSSFFSGIWASRYALRSFVHEPPVRHKFAQNIKYLLFQFVFDTDFGVNREKSAGPFVFSTLLIYS